MHQLWKRSNGRWYILYGPRLGRQISTCTKDRRKAEQVLARFIATEGERPGEHSTVGEVLAGYVAFKVPKVRSPKSLTYGVLGLKPLEHLYTTQLTPPVIGKWARERGVADGTVLREVGILRAALAWALENQWIDELPKISNPVKTPAAKERWITKAEAKRLLDGCREPHMRVFIMLALMTAARTGAILEATWDRVDWDKKTISFGRGHGNKRRAAGIPINPELLLILRGAKAVACSDYIVEFRGRRVKTVKTGFAAACDRAELVDVTPHVLRHTAATWATMDGVPLAQVARMLGDSEATVERIYAKHAPEYLRAATAALQLQGK